MIKLQVIGHLGKDALQNDVNGKSVINFNVAHSEKWKDAHGNEKQKTIWVDCAYWTDRTGILPYLKKGTQVFVEGAPEVRVFERADGTTGASLTMRVLSVQLLGSSNNNNNQSQNSQPGTATETSYIPPADTPVDDLPF